MIERPETIMSKDPKDNNFLSPLNFKFVLKRAPNLNFFLQKVNIPGLTVPPIVQPTPFVDIMQAGVNVKFNPLVASFRVDENLQNYMEIATWMKVIGEEKSTGPYARLAKKPMWSGESVKSDITISILDSARNANFTFYFHDCFPIGLSDMIFDVQPNGIEVQAATATFRYTNWDLEKVV